VAYAAIMLLSLNPFSVISIEDADWYWGIVIPDKPNALLHWPNLIMYMCVLLNTALRVNSNDNVTEQGVRTDGSLI